MDPLSASFFGDEEFRFAAFSGGGEMRGKRWGSAEKQGRSILSGREAMHTTAGSGVATVTVWVVMAPLSSAVVLVVVVVGILFCKKKKEKKKKRKRKGKEGFQRRNGRVGGGLGYLARYVRGTPAMEHITP